MVDETFGEPVADALNKDIASIKAKTTFECGFAQGTDDRDLIDKGKRLNRILLIAVVAAALGAFIGENAGRVALLWAVTIHSLLVILNTIALVQSQPSGSLQALRDHSWRFHGRGLRLRSRCKSILLHV